MAFAVSMLTGNAFGGALGAYQAGAAQAEAAKFNAKVAQNNEAISHANAAIAGQAGAEQGWMVGQKTRGTLGAIKANQGASNVDVNSGSAADVRASTEELGQLDAMTVRSNAAREAYGYQQQAEGFKEQSVLDTYEAKNDVSAGELNAVNTFMGSAGSAASNFAKFQMAGGISG